MAADMEYVGLSRVHVYEYKCILPLRDNCLFWHYTLLTLLDCTQSSDNLFHSFPVLWEKEYFLKIQPTLPFHQREIISSSYFTCLNFEKYFGDYMFMTIQYLKNFCLIPPPSSIFASPVLLEHIPSIVPRS